MGSAPGESGRSYAAHQGNGCQVFLPFWKENNENHTVPQVLDESKGVIGIVTHMRFCAFNSFLCFLTSTVARILSVKHLPCA